MLRSPFFVLLLQCSYIRSQGSYTNTSLDSTNFFVYVDVTSSLVCALNASGYLKCWSSDGNSRGEMNVPSSSQGSYASFSLGGCCGSIFGCAVDTNGSMSCWGSNSNGQGTIPGGHIWRNVSCGSLHTCAIDSLGMLLCWGYNFFGETTVPGGHSPWYAVSAGDQNSCGIDAAFNVVCWGTAAYAILAPPSGNTPWRNGIYVGGASACSFSNVSALVCWGTGGEASIQTTGNSTQWHMISAGYNRVCGIDAARTLQSVSSVPNYAFLDSRPIWSGLSCRGIDAVVCGLDLSGFLSCWNYNNTFPTFSASGTASGMPSPSGSRSLTASTTASPSATKTASGSQSPSPSYTIAALPYFSVSTVYGGGSSGTQAGAGNGIGTSALFSGLYGLSLDPALGSTLYVVTSDEKDPTPGAVRKIDTATGMVSTVAGGTSSSCTNGVGSNAGFLDACSTWGDGRGSLYVVDARCNNLRHVNLSTSEVTLYAGSASGLSGCSVGSRSAALLGGPFGLLGTRAGDRLYLSESTNCRILAISTINETVSVLAGPLTATCGFVNLAGTNARFNYPNSLALDTTEQNLFVSDERNAVIRKVNLATIAVTTFVSGLTSYNGGSFTSIYLAADLFGNLIVADYSGSIRSINMQTAVASVIAGTGVRGYAVDGPASSARFNLTTSVVVDRQSNIFLTDYVSNTVRVLVPMQHTSTPSLSPTATLTPSPSPSYTAAPLTYTTVSTLFSSTADFVYHVSLDNADSLFLTYFSGVIDHFNLTTQTRSRIAGTASIPSICKNGPFAEASFRTITGSWYMRNHQLLVVDYDCHNLRILDLASGNVSVLAGSEALSATGASDAVGTTATFYHPYRAAVDPYSDAIYVVDSWNHKVRIVSRTTGSVSTLAGGGASGTSFGSTNAVGTNALFYNPAAITLDPTSTYAYISDESTVILRRIHLPSATVTTFAGTSGRTGYSNGAGTNAEFARFGNFFSLHLATDLFGGLYVADANCVIRRFDVLTAIPTVVAGNGTAGWKDGAALASLFQYTTSLAVDAESNVLATDFDLGHLRILQRAAQTPSPSGTGSISPSSTSSGTLTPSLSMTESQTSSTSGSLTASASSSSAPTMSVSRSAAVTLSPSPSGTIVPQHVQATIPPRTSGAPPPPGFSAIVGDVFPPLKLALSLSSLTLAVSPQNSQLVLPPTYWAIACAAKVAVLRPNGLPEVSLPTSPTGGSIPNDAAFQYIALSPPFLPLSVASISGDTLLFNSPSPDSLTLLGLVNLNNSDLQQLRALAVTCSLIGAPASSGASTASLVDSVATDLRGQMALAAQLIESYGVHDAANAASVGLSLPIASQTIFVLHISALSLPLFSSVILPSGEGKLRCVWDTDPSNYAAAHPAATAASGGDSDRKKLYRNICSAFLPNRDAAHSDADCSAAVSTTSSSLGHKAPTMQLQLSGPTSLVLLGGSWLSGASVTPFFDNATTVTVGGVACAVDWVASDGSMLAFTTPPISPFCQQGGINGTAASASASAASSVRRNGTALENGLCGYATIVVARNSILGHPSVLDWTSTSGIAAALSLAPQVARLDAAVSCPPVCPTLPGVCGMQTAPPVAVMISGDYPNVEIKGMYVVTPTGASTAISTAGVLPPVPTASIFYSPLCINFTDPSTGLCTNSSDSSSSNCAFVSLETGLCQRCPVGALCPSGVRVWPRVGYWMPNEFSPGSLAACTPPAQERCLGWDIETGQSLCGTRYQGSLCGMCSSGYYAESTGACIACPPSATLWDRIAPCLSLVGILLAIFMLIYALVLAVQARYGGTVKEGLRRTSLFVLWLVQILQLIAQSGSQSSSNTPSFLLQLYDTLRILLFRGFTLPPACTSASTLGVPRLTVEAGCLLGLGCCILMVYHWPWKKPWLWVQASSVESGSSTRDSKGGTKIVVAPFLRTNTKHTLRDRLGSMLLGLKNALPKTAHALLSLVLKAMLFCASLSYPTVTNESMKLMTCIEISVSASDYARFYDGDGTSLSLAGIDGGLLHTSVALQQTGGSLTEAQSTLLSTLLHIRILRAYPSAVCGETAQPAAYSAALGSFLFFTIGIPVLSLILLCHALAARARLLRKEMLTTSPSASAPLTVAPPAMSCGAYFCKYRYTVCCARDSLDDARLDGDSPFNNEESLAFFLSSGVFRASHFFHRQLDWLSILMLTCSQYSSAGGVGGTSVGEIVGLFIFRIAIPLVALCLLLVERPAIKGAEWIVQVKTATTLVFVVSTSLNSLQAFSDFLQATTGETRASLASVLVNAAIVTYFLMMSLFALLIIAFIRSLISGAVSEEKALTAPVAQEALPLGQQLNPIRAKDAAMDSCSPKDGGFQHASTASATAIHACTESRTSPPTANADSAVANRPSGVVPAAFAAAKSTRLKMSVETSSVGTKMKGIAGREEEMDRLALSRASVKPSMRNILAIPRMSPFSPLPLATAGVPEQAQVSLFAPTTVRIIKSGKRGVIDSSGEHASSNSTKQMVSSPLFQAP